MTQIPDRPNETVYRWKILQPGFFVENSWVYVFGPIAIVAFSTAYHLTNHYVFLHAYRASAICLAALAFLALYRYPGPKTLARMALYFAMCFVLYQVLQRTADALLHEPSEWDFICFFLDGNVAAAGLNLYRPDSYVQMANILQLTPSEEFHREVLQVGFKYPPPTVMLFMPLSLFDIQTANALWISLIAATVFVAILLLSRLLDNRGSNGNTAVGVLDSIAIAAVLAMSIPPTRTAISMGQTTPILCCCIILVLLGRGRFSSGISASLSALVKPLAVVPALILLIGRYWSAVNAGAIAGVLLLVLSILVLGTDDWATYLRQEYATAAPAWIYHEPINQSLLGTLCRVLGVTEVPWSIPSVVLIYAVLSLIIALPSLWLAAKIVQKDFQTAYCLLLVVALLVYPGTQTTYGMLLSIPMAIEFRNHLRYREHEFMTLAFLAVTVVLFGLGMFAADVFVWLVLLRRSLILSGMTVKDTERLTATVVSH